MGWPNIQCIKWPISSEMSTMITTDHDVNNIPSIAKSLIYTFL